MARDVKNTKEYEAEYGLSAHSSVRGPDTESRLTRSNIKNVIQFSVNQGDEATCVYVTTAKVCVYNVVGLGMNTTLTQEEKELLDRTTRLFKLRSDSALVDRDLNSLNITPETCSPKAYTLIVLFFYFYDWLRMNKIRCYYRPGPKIDLLDDKSEPYYSKIQSLFDFLKLTKKRAGAQFTSSGWIQGVTTALEPLVEPITWNMISVCTLNTPWSSGAPKFTSEQFQAFCRVIFEMTKKFKIILTLKGEMNEMLHDVMVVGIENGKMIISNSWGNEMDLVPTETLPLVELTLPNSTKSRWNAFQFTFLLPKISGFEHPLYYLKRQYYADDLDDLIFKITPYLDEMNERPLPQIDEELLTTLARDPSARIGGKRKLTKRRKLRRYTRFVRLRQ